MGDCSRFEASAAVLEHFPSMTLAVAVARGIDNARPPAGLDARWHQAYARAGALELANAQSHPHVAELRAQLKGAGIPAKKFPSSIEAMLRRALKGGELFSVNPLVDFYNALSLEHLCPAGAFDLAALDAPLELRHTRAGDTFTALGETRTVTVEPGEIGYASASTVLTRHFMWRQSREAMVGAATRDVFLVAEIPGIAGRDTAEALLEAMGEGLERFFGAGCERALLDRDRPAFDW